MAHHFRYRTIELHKTEVLGTGSYGSVCRAKCDDLPCAAKILHRVLLQSNDPGTINIIRKFNQECNFMRSIRHSRIVPYLGMYRDPESRLPVLLMDIMDESLTRYLERSQEPLPYHTELNLCHDVAMALSYLHSNDIIHRDLSSNNVLLAGSTAKVTDFGMAKVFSVNHTRTPLTMCPGTLAYMSPEALRDPPSYTKKLDCFSFGVLGIQILTRQFPNPDPATRLVEDGRYPMGRVQVLVPETERRRSHIDLVDPTHPLLPIATNCLSYNEGERPSAQQLCRRLAALKQAPQYGESVQQAQERRTPAGDTDREERERRIRELQQQEEQAQETHHLQQQVEDRDRQLQEKDRQLEEKDRQLGEKDRVIAESEQQTQQLQQQYSQQIGRLRNLLCPLQQRITELVEQGDRHVEETQRLRDEHDRQVGEISQQCSQQVEGVRQQHSQELEGVREQHSQELEERREQHSQELEELREQHSQELEELGQQHSQQVQELRGHQCWLIEVNQELGDQHSQQIEDLRQQCSQQVKDIWEQRSDEIQQVIRHNEWLREHRSELLGQTVKQAQELNQLRLELAEKDRQVERKSQELSKNHAQFQHRLMLKENAFRSKQTSLSVKDLQIEQLEQQLSEARGRAARGGCQGERDGRVEQSIGTEAGGGSRKKRKLEDGRVVEKATSGRKRRRVEGGRSGGRMQLHWREGGHLPSVMNRGASAVDHRVAYFNCSGHGCVYAWDLRSEQWSTLPECPQTCFSLAVVNGLLTAIGGTLSGQATNTLLSLTGKGKRRKWSKEFPPMPTKRWASAAVRYRDSLIVAGGTTGAGELKDNLATVEVMNTETCQWFTASSLPRPLALASATMCGDRLYILRGKSAFTCSLSKHSLSTGAQQKMSSPSLPLAWQKVANLPTYYATCAALHGQLLAVGGLDKDGSKSDAVYRYCSSANSWEVISHMPSPQYDCLVAVLPSSELMVVGGGSEDRMLTASIV